MLLIPGFAIWVLSSKAKEEGLKGRLAFTAADLAKPKNSIFIQNIVLRKHFPSNS